MSHSDKSDIIMEFFAEKKLEDLTWSLLNLCQSICVLSLRYFEKKKKVSLYSLKFDVEESDQGFWYTIVLELPNHPGGRNNKGKKAIIFIMNFERWYHCDIKE